MAISFQGGALYKKTSTGKIQSWRIFSRMNEIVTLYGQVDGKIQETSETISEGKNQGKTNETTPEQQAYREAEARWTKQLKKGYVKSIEEAQAGKVDDVIEGGVFPMLAFPFEKQGHKIAYPCYGNPKLDGTRCIAQIQDGVCTLWSRTRKPITSMPHIVKALEEAFPSGGYSFDGELYAAHLGNDFEQLIHLVRQVTPTEGHEKMQYWIYDMPIGQVPFEERYKTLLNILPEKHPIVLVTATPLKSEAEAMDFFAECQTAGYEGAILRNASGLYINKRSADLIKVKSFFDDEFEIVGIEEGRGRLSGHVGAFICRTKTSQEFRAKLKGSTGYLSKLFHSHSLWKNKRLTVQYQNMTVDGVPRFPVGVSIRDYE